jgi:hypothetical protein
MEYFEKNNIHYAENFGEYITPERIIGVPPSG